MKIVADKDIYGVEETFSSAGELVLLPGREISNQDVASADALIVRTTTKITSALIKNSTLKFIGSATSGFDHVDINSLQKCGIGFSHAPGCNANAVVDYVFSALAWSGLKNKTDFRNQSIGIIGAGNVGSRLALKAAALGMEVLVYDPFLESSHELASYFCSLEEVLEQKIVTLHTPLTQKGTHPTYHMLDTVRLNKLRQGAVLINAARGEIIDNQALDHLLDSRTDLNVILDVWEGEPFINRRLAQQVSIATPHIAGYSLKGKITATEMIYRAFCNRFGVGPAATKAKEKSQSLVLSQTSKPDDDACIFPRLLLQGYPIQEDILKNEFAGDSKKAADNFDQERSNYLFRHEFSDYVLDAKKYSFDLNSDLEVLGFKLN
jgi:erythronate-4-phosphate dehydrogenase